MTLEKVPAIFNFIGGLGGKDISKRYIREAFETLLLESGEVTQERIHYMNVRCAND